MALIYTNQSSRGTKKGKRMAARSKAALQRQNEELERKYKTTYSNTSSGAGKKLETKIVSPVVTRQPIREIPYYPSLNSGASSTAAPPKKVYTGTLIKGIATMHKSNAVPIIDEQHAIDIAHMRR